MPVSQLIVEYYLALLPGIIPSHARARLRLVSVNDASPESLSAKLLARPRLLSHISSLIPDRSRACPARATRSSTSRAFLRRELLTNARGWQNASSG